jgi:asparagine synthase (glutamine-hydrolysing)
VRHGFTNLNILRFMADSFLPKWVRKKLSLQMKKDKIEWLNIKYDTSGITDYGVHKNIRSLSLEQIQRLSVPMLLHYEDRNSMAHSIEARVPFLDHRLVEFDLNLGDTSKIRNAETKYILREALKDVLPEKIKNRQDKMGFVTPEFVWIKENREIFAKEIDRACNNLKPLINSDKVKKWFDEMLETEKNFDHTLWRLICLGRWVEVFNVKL